MKRERFINILKKTAKKLKEKNSKLLTDIKNVDYQSIQDPENSILHDLWHTYRLQREFLEFINNMLLEKYNIPQRA